MIFNSNADLIKSIQAHLVLFSEGHDRTDLLLPGHQEDLLKQLKTAGKPMIVVVMSGGPVDISYAKVWCII